MVYTSIPPYIDPPNWNQHQGVHQGGGSSGGVGRISGDHQESHQSPPSMVPRNDSGRIGVAAGTRPGSMAEMARQAKIPQPEQPLNCPRCDSTNTKFCYFNNYSLSQPRHFCKTCRRYWTRGGALRNVPVGGGCRRNKRTKASNSKNLSINDAKSGGSMAINNSNLPINRGGAIRSSISGPVSLPFLGSLHPFSDYGSGTIGLNFAGIQSVDPANYQIGSSSGSGGLDQWRMEQVQQFPLFTNVDQPSMPPPTTIPMYQFETEPPTGFAGNVHGKESGSGIISQLSSVNMEENSHGMNLSRQNLGMPGNVGYWESNGGGNGNGSSSGMRNTDLSVFSSSTINNFF